MKFSCPKCGEKAEINTLIGAYGKFCCSKCGLKVFDPIRMTLNKYNLIFIALYIAFLIGMKAFFTNLPYELAFLLLAAVCFIVALRLVQQKICMDFLNSEFAKR